MSGQSKIEWTDATWNPVTGCTKVSPGCKHCYAERITKRWGGDFSKVTLHPDRLDAPLHWRKPRMVFVNSMSDLFHEDVPDYFIDDVFDVCAVAANHTFQILTKRPERMMRYCQDDDRSILHNVWLGVSVEDQQRADERIPHLLQTPAAVRFLSVEPMLGPVALSAWLGSIDWVICGGESGPGARPMDQGWARILRDQCVHAGVPFFFKQWGGVKKKRTGRVLDGRTWDEMPNVFREEK